MSFDPPRFPQTRRWVECVIEGIGTLEKSGGGVGGRRFPAPAAWLPSADLLDRQELWDAEGRSRSGTEQNHIEAEFAMKGTHPPQAGFFHGFFQILEMAGEFRFVLYGLAFGADF